MRKRIALALLCLVIGVAAQAQRVVYNVIAQVPFDARTQQYGKMVPKDMRIIKRGDETIYIGAEKYDVVEVVRCKDCNRCYEKRTKRNEQLMRFCMRMDRNEYQVNANDFCSYGTPKERGADK